MDGDRLLANDGYRLVMYDISGDVEPRWLGQLDFETPWISPTKLQGDFAYLATGSDFRIADFRDPSAPRWIAQLPLEDAHVATALAVTGDLAIVATHSGGRLHLVDISDPLAPARVGGFTEDGAVVNSLAAYGSRVIVATDTTVGVWDVSDRAAPVRLAPLVAGASPFYTNGQVSAVKVDGNRAWLAAGEAGVVVGLLPDRELPWRIALPVAWGK